METTHHHTNPIMRVLMRELHMFYVRENHTIGNYVFLYFMVAVGILFFLLAFEVWM